MSKEPFNFLAYYIYRSSLIPLYRPIEGFGFLDLVGKMEISILMVVSIQVYFALGKFGRDAEALQQVEGGTTVAVRWLFQTIGAIGR